MRLGSAIFMVGLLVLAAGCPAKNRHGHSGATDGGTDRDARAGDAGGTHGGATDAGTLAGDAAALHDAGNDASQVSKDASAGTDASTSEDAGTASTGCPGGCGSGVCVKEQTVGGAHILADDAGTCPPPRIVVPEAPGFCSPLPTFHCATLPAACGTTPSCSCVGNLCHNAPLCISATTKLVVCVLQAP